MHTVLLVSLAVASKQELAALSIILNTLNIKNKIKSNNSVAAATLRRKARPEYPAHRSG